VVVQIRSKNEHIIYRKDLVQANNLKQVFDNIRHFLAGNILGITRDEILAEQLIFLLFCKMRDELISKPKDAVMFQTFHPSSIKLNTRVSRLFDDLKLEYETIFEEKDEIIVDEKSLELIVKELEKYCITEASRDAIGDAFEIFLGPSLRGNKGQFITPKNVVKTMIRILDLQEHEKIIDPACGSGGFLIEAATYDRKQQNSELLQENTIFGIDKDQFLAKIANIYLAILGTKRKSIYCENSLVHHSEWSSETIENIPKEHFDIVVTNPPFGTKIPIKSKKTLEQYELGFKWRKNSHSSQKWHKTKIIQDKQPPQVLFIEKCLNLLKKGGRMGIVLPDGLFGNPSNRYILQFLLEKTKIIAVISCSHITFLPHTHTKTSLLFLEKTPPLKDYSFFMAIADNVGHDKNGKPLYFLDKIGNHLLNSNNEKIINDDFPKIIKSYQKFRNNKLNKYSRLGFSFQFSDIKNFILIPEYYNPDISTQLNSIREKNEFQLISMKFLLDKNLINITRGHEIGSKFYGTGEIPFIRTSDLINWELNIDAKKKVSREIFNLYKKKQDVQANDILLVCDGTFLIGKTAMITENDTQIIIQSHLKKIRVLNRELLDEYILLWSLNTDIVQSQIRSKTFIQATISTLGNRIEEIMIPIPIDAKQKRELSQEIQQIIITKMKLKKRIQNSSNLI